MPRSDLDPPTKKPPTGQPTADSFDLILRLTESVERRITEAVEQMTAQQAAVELELRCFTPAQAAALLGKTTNWVVEAIQARRIPFTYVGKSPRLTAAHIRQIQAQGEVQPSKYAKPIAAQPARAA